MSAIFSANGSELGVVATNGICRILALYQDGSARMETVQMCNRLLERYSNDLFFDFSWLNYQQLADPVLALRAREAAVSADIVILCGRSEDLPPVVIRWLDDWVASGKKYSRKTIAFLPTERAGASSPVGKVRHRLEKYASALGMNFLSLAPPGAKALDAYKQQSFVPPPTSAQASDDLQFRWGLNE